MEGQICAFWCVVGFLMNNFYMQGSYLWLLLLDETVHLQKSARRI